MSYPLQLLHSLPLYFISSPFIWRYYSIQYSICFSLQFILLHILRGRPLVPYLTLLFLVLPFLEGSCALSVVNVSSVVLSLSFPLHSIGGIISYRILADISFRLSVSFVLALRNISRAIRGASFALRLAINNIHICFHSIFSFRHSIFSVRSEVLFHLSYQSLLLQGGFDLFFLSLSSLGY